VTRIARAALLAAASLALAAPAAHAASPSATVKPPTAGDVTMAHLVFATKGGSGTPKLTIANRAKLSKQLTIAGGVKKLKKNSYLASIALLHRTGGGKSATPSFKLSLPKGMKFSKFTAKLIAKNLLSNSATPKFCGARPDSFAYVSKKLLAGSFPPRFASAQELVIAGYDLNCPNGSEERANLAASLRGEPDPGAAPGPGGPGSDPGEDEDEEGGGTQFSPTLQGTGTVIAEGGDVFRYEISFNEPVHGYMLDGAGNVRCPTDYGEWKAAECEPLGNSQSVNAGGQTFTCTPGEYTFQFSCLTPMTGDRRSGSASRPTVPAGTQIVGRFKTHAGANPTTGKAKLIGYGPNGQSQPAALSGP
jgi:hypothetical protein